MGSSNMVRGHLTKLYGEIGAYRAFALICISIAAASPALCAPPQTFKGAAADAAQHFGTPEGHAYAMTFVRGVLKATYDATQACKQSPRGAIHNIVFIVSSS